MKDYYTELSIQNDIEQLQQLTHLTWDGDLIGKTLRDDLVKRGLAVRANGGWNIATPAGIEYLHKLGHIQP